MTIPLSAGYCPECFSKSNALTALNNFMWKALLLTSFTNRKWRHKDVTELAKVRLVGSETARI